MLLRYPGIFLNRSQIFEVGKTVEMCRDGCVFSKWIFLGQFRERFFLDEAKTGLAIKLDLL